MADNIQIIPYKDELKEFVKILNEEWLKKYFKVEETDHIQLYDPKKEILDKGGKIFFVKYKDQIVGTVSLMKINKETYELSKMAVKEKFQGKGIGKLLIEYSIKAAKESGMKKLIFVLKYKIAACNSFI